jgi:hypothetical protein
MGFFMYIIPVKTLLDNIYIIVVCVDIDKVTDII